MEECEILRYVVNQTIIPLYLETANTFLNLSAGAVALTVTFREKIVGAGPGEKVGIFMLISWVFYLLSIGASAVYQYFAVKFLDSVSCFPGKIQYFEHLVRNPGVVYGLMLICFYLGSLFLVISAWRQVPKKNS